MEEIILYLKSKQKLLTIIILVLTFVALLVYPIILLNKKPSEAKTKISVEVAGAVKKPGLFTLDKTERVADAISLAGGTTEEADKEYINSMLNQARILEDGEKILIPKVSSAKTQASNKTTTISSSNKTSSEKASAGQIININTGSLDELDTLPGIGATYAQRIIDYRTQNGDFKSIGEIENVKGIGPKTFEKLKDLITI
ncbi:MAG: helix-hairpin-helix domain-containing protein [Patescibacteria group bacterium]|nr:helix-hairpin-helix domain-containing protein [Patescibacteria group bacterium]